MKTIEAKDLRPGMITALYGGAEDVVESVATSKSGKTLTATFVGGGNRKFRAAQLIGVKVAPEADAVTPDEPEAETAAVKEETVTEKIDAVISKYGVGLSHKALASKVYRELTEQGVEAAILNDRYIMADGVEYQFVKRARTWTAKAFTQTAPAAPQEAAPETEAAQETETADAPEPKAGMKFCELPEAVQNDVKECLRAYDDCSVIYEYGAYHVSAGAFIQKNYAPDFKVCGRFAATDIFTPEEHVLNYANSFYEYPIEYHGKRDYRMMADAAVRGAKLGYDDAGNICMEDEPQTPDAATPEAETPVGETEAAAQAETRLDIAAFYAKYVEEYGFCKDNGDNVAGFAEAVEAFGAFCENEANAALVREFCAHMGDYIASDREAAAFMFAFEGMTAPPMCETEAEASETVSEAGQPAPQADTTDEEKLDALFNELVPVEGKADTVAGEIVRAVCRIGYRYNNDGDYVGHGYGKETCNPAARYLIANAGENVAEIVRCLWAAGEECGALDDGSYEDWLSELVKATLTYLEANPEPKTTPNAVDMWEYRDPEEDVDDEWDEEDEDADEWGAA